MASSVPVCPCSSSASLTCRPFKVRIIYKIPPERCPAALTCVVALGKKDGNLVPQASAAIKPSARRCHAAWRARASSKDEDLAEKAPSAQPSLISNRRQLLVFTGVAAALAASNTEAKAEIGEDMACLAASFVTSLWAPVFLACGDGLATFQVSS